MSVRRFTKAVFVASMFVVAACSESRSIVATIELREAPSICMRPSFSLDDQLWRSDGVLSVEESIAPLSGDLVIFDNDSATLTLESGRVLGFKAQQGFSTLECRIPS